MSKKKKKKKKKKMTSPFRQPSTTRSGGITTYYRKGKECQCASKRPAGLTEARDRRHANRSARQQLLTNVFKFVDRLVKTLLRKLAEANSWVPFAKDTSMSAPNLCHKVNASACGEHGVENFRAFMFSVGWLAVPLYTLRVPRRVDVYPRMAPPRDSRRGEGRRHADHGLFLRLPAGRATRALPARRDPRRRDGHVHATRSRGTGRGASFPGDGGAYLSLFQVPGRGGVHSFHLFACCARGGGGAGVGKGPPGNVLTIRL